MATTEFTAAGITALPAQSAAPVQKNHQESRDGGQ